MIYRMRFQQPYFLFTVLGLLLAAHLRIYWFGKKNESIKLKFYMYYLINKLYCLYKKKKLLIRQFM